MELAHVHPALRLEDNACVAAMNALVRTCTLRGRDGVDSTEGMDDRQLAAARAVVVARARQWPSVEAVTRLRRVDGGPPAGGEEAWPMAVACYHRARATATYRLRDVGDAHGYMGPIDEAWLQQWYDPSRPRLAEREAGRLRALARLVRMGHRSQAVASRSVGGGVTAAEQHNFLRRYDDRVPDWLAIAMLQAMGLPHHVRTPFQAHGGRSVSCHDACQRWRASNVAHDISARSTVAVPLPSQPSHPQWSTATDVELATAATADTPMTACMRDVLLAVASGGRRRKRVKLTEAWDVACDPRVPVATCVEELQRVVSAFLRQHVGLSIVVHRQGKKRSRQSAGLTVGQSGALTAMVRHHPALRECLHEGGAYEQPGEATVRCHSAVADGIVLA